MGRDQVLNRKGWWKANAGPFPLLPHSPWRWQLHVYQNIRITSTYNGGKSCSVISRLQQEMKKVYLKQQHKIVNMTKTQIRDTENGNINYTRIANHTNIQFTHDGI
jgi:hypothetical protein